MKLAFKLEYRYKLLPMKTLPYLKQLTYATIIMAFPFIFSASKDSKTPDPIKTGIKNEHPTTFSANETLKTIRVTVDSLKNTGATLTKIN